MAWGAIKNKHPRYSLDDGETQHTRLNWPQRTFHFHWQREGRGNRVWLLRSAVYGPRADDDVAERRPDGG